MARNVFNTVEMARVESSRFDLSHDVKLSFNMGGLYPVCVMECMPGDKFRISPENLLRFAPLVAPVMHRIKVTTHYFFVPNRILWQNWDEWITGNLEVEAPYITFSEGDPFIDGSIWDYLGYPTNEGGFGPAEGLKVSPFPISAYVKIYDEYYRDQNLIEEKWKFLTDGSMDLDDVFVGGAYNSPVFKRAWSHDYFTSCLPFAQKGDSVQIPLTSQDNIPIQAIQGTPPNTPPGWYMFGNPDEAESGTLNTGSIGDTVEVDTDPGQYLRYDPKGTLVVDVQSDAVDINTLRRAFRLQEWLEKNARGGTRYTEHLMAHFGVRSSDARLQRPEYIGGLKQNMVISEVLSTAQNTADDAFVGAMAGHGISVGGGNSFSHYCEEHGWIIGIMSVMPDTAYQNGLHRSYTRFDRLDYPWPTFANIGEQEVRVKELFVNEGDNESMEEVFGYIPRYSEMRFINSRVAGDFKGTLSFWHLGRIFSSAPVLNSEFIECNPRTDIFAVEDGTDTIWAHVINNVSVIRKLPQFGVPTI